MNSSRLTHYRSNLIERTGRTSGFTLVELIVVIVVIALLASIMAPFTNTAGERARQNLCRSRLRGLYDGVAAYGGENRNRVPLVHEPASFAMIGNILPTGGRFAEKYLKQSWKSSSGGTVTMMSEDNIFQCPSALGNIDKFRKDQGTNYQLSAFALDTGSGADDALHPSLLTIGGTVQSTGNSQTGSKTHPAGEIVMAMDWLWDRSGQGVGGYSSGASLANHRDGANVLYGSGAAKWFGYGKMLKVPTATGFLRPPRTYGFLSSGSGGTSIFAPCGEVIKGGVKDKKPGVGVMW